MFITDQELHFNLNRHPIFSEFFNNDLSNFHDSTYFIQKLGHFICFFFLAMLLLWALKRLDIVIVVSIGLAFLTEIAQMFFSRSGRLLDVVYDSAGLMLFVVLYLCTRLVEWVYRKVYLSEVRRH
jgi:VanZ family protein